MIKKRCLVFRLSLLFILMTTMSGFLSEKSITKSNLSSSWINRDYLDCLKNGFPCECEKKTNSFFIVRFESKKKTNLKLSYCRHEDMEFYSFWVKKVGDRFKTFDYRDNTRVVGEFYIKDTLLHYTDINGITKVFVNIKPGKFKDDESLYHYENTRNLNSSFSRRGYPTLNAILDEKKLRSYCNKWLGGVNIITGDSLSWIIELNDDSAYIFKKIDTGDALPETFTKKRIQAFKW
jgi:hypothetical protein